MPPSAPSRLVICGRGPDSGASGRGNSRWIRTGPPVCRVAGGVGTVGDARDLDGRGAGGGPPSVRGRPRTGRLPSTARQARATHAAPRGRVVGAVAAPAHRGRDASGRRDPGDTYRPRIGRRDPGAGCPGMPRPVPARCDPRSRRARSAAGSAGDGVAETDGGRRDGAGAAPPANRAGPPPQDRPVRPRLPGHRGDRHPTRSSTIHRSSRRPIRKPAPLPFRHRTPLSGAPRPCQQVQQTGGRSHRLRLGGPGFGGDRLWHLAEVAGCGGAEAPVFRAARSREGQPVGLRQAFEVREGHPGLLPGADRRDAGVGPGDRAGPVPRVLMGVARDLADGADRREPRPGGADRAVRRAGKGATGVVPAAGRGAARSWCASTSRSACRKGRRTRWPARRRRRPPPGSRRPGARSCRGPECGARSAARRRAGRACRPIRGRCRRQRKGRQHVRTVAVDAPHRPERRPARHGARRQAVSAARRSGCRSNRSAVPTGMSRTAPTPARRIGAVAATSTAARQGIAQRCPERDDRAPRIDRAVRAAGEEGSVAVAPPEPAQRDLRGDIVPGRTDVAAPKAAPSRASGRPRAARVPAARVPVARVACSSPRAPAARVPAARPRVARVPAARVRAARVPAAQVVVFVATRAPHVSPEDRPASASMREASAPDAPPPAGPSARHRVRTVPDRCRNGSLSQERPWRFPETVGWSGTRSARSRRQTRRHAGPGRTSARRRRPDPIAQQRPAGSIRTIGAGSTESRPAVPWKGRGRGRGGAAEGAGPWKGRGRGRGGAVERGGALPDAAEAREPADRPDRTIHGNAILEEGPEEQCTPRVVPPPHHRRHPPCPERTEPGARTPIERGSSAVCPHGGPPDRLAVAYDVNALQVERCQSPPPRRSPVFVVYAQPTGNGPAVCLIRAGSPAIPRRLSRRDPKCPGRSGTLRCSTTSGRGSPPLPSGPCRLRWRG